MPLRVTVEPERADAAPGDNLQFAVTVRNASDIVEHYGIEMLGLPDGSTVRTEPDVAKLRPSETGMLTVRVSLPVRPPAPAGTYVVGALVRSPYRHDVSRCVEVPIELANVEQITVKATPEVVTGGRGGQYTVEITNGGNAPVRLYLTATDPERRVTAAFQPPTVDLPPGTSARALLTVSAPLPWNREKQRQLTITATPDLPGAAPASSAATFVQTPRFASKFAKVAGIGAAVLALAAAIAVPALVTRANAEKAAQAAQTAPATTAATAVAPPPASAAPPSQAVSSAAAPSSAAPPSSAAVSSAPASASAPADGGVRSVDLTAPQDGVLASDVFRNQGFLVSADPGTTAVAGCENARSAAVVTGADSRRFLTSSLPDDPTKCHEVPVMIDFLPDSPAGAVQVTPLTAGTLSMEVVFRDLSRLPADGLTVTADQVKPHGGIDFVLIRPVAAASPVAVTKISFAALG